MKLLIISHTPHYMNGTQLKGWGATVREIDYLAELFDEIIHIAPLYTGKPPKARWRMIRQSIVCACYARRRKCF